MFTTADHDDDKKNDNGGGGNRRSGTMVINDTSNKNSIDNIVSSVTNTEVNNLLSSFDINTMKNLDDGTREILLSLIETINNLMSDRTELNERYTDCQQINDTLTIEIDTYKLENERLIEQNKVLTEQISQLTENLKELETPRLQLPQLSSMFSGPISENEETDDKSKDANDKDGKKDSSNDDSNNSGRQKQDSVDSITDLGINFKVKNKKHDRQTSLLNDRQIELYKLEIDKKDKELEKITNETKAKQEEMLHIEKEIGDMKKLENENKELQSNLNKLENKFQIEIEKYEKRLGELQREHRKVSELNDELQESLNDQQAFHSEQIHRFSVAVCCVLMFFLCFCFVVAIFFVVFFVNGDSVILIALFVLCYFFFSRDLFFLAVFSFGTDARTGR